MPVVPIEKSAVSVIKCKKEAVILFTASLINNILLNNYTKGAFTTFAGMFLFLT
jgi:hypothetical protein